MIKIPDEFCNTPEAKRLLEAQAEFEKALEREKRLTQESGERVHLTSSQLRRAQEELETAEKAFDLATGEPKPARLTEAVLHELKKQFPLGTHQQVINLLEKECGRTIPFHREAEPSELENIRLAVLRLSKGDTGQLRKWVELANVDWPTLLNALDSEKYHECIRIFREEIGKHFHSQEAQSYEELFARNEQGYPKPPVKIFDELEKLNKGGKIQSARFQQALQDFYSRYVNPNEALH